MISFKIKAKILWLVFGHDGAIQYLTTNTSVKTLLKQRFFKALLDVLAAIFTRFKYNDRTSRVLDRLQIKAGISDE